MQHHKLRVLSSMLHNRQKNKTKQKNNDTVTLKKVTQYTQMYI